MKDIEVVVFQDKSWVRIKEYQKVKEENEQLKARIERMKCCGNCFHNNKPSDKEFCWNCERQLDERPIIKDEWELAE